MAEKINARHLEFLAMLDRLKEPVIYLDFVRNNLFSEALELVDGGFITKTKKQAYWKVEGGTEYFYELSSAGKQYLDNIVGYAFKKL